MKKCPKRRHRKSAADFFLAGVDGKGCLDVVTEESPIGRLGSSMAGSEEAVTKGSKCY